MVKAMKNLIKNLSNTQKKILAAILAITCPIWILVVIPLFVLFAVFALIYAHIADAIGVEIDE